MLAQPPASRRQTDLQSCVERVGDYRVLYDIGILRGMLSSLDRCFGGSGAVRRDISAVLGQLETDVTHLYQAASETDVASLNESFRNMRHALQERRGHDIESSDSPSRYEFDTNLRLVSGRAQDLTSRLIARCLSGELE